MEVVVGVSRHCGSTDPRTGAIGQMNCKSAGVKLSYFWALQTIPYAIAMKNLASYIFPVLLIVVGGALLIIGAMQGQNGMVLLGAGLALLAGIISLLLQMGIIGRQVGMLIGIVFALVAVGLAYLNYRSVEKVIEFNERKLQSDRKLIQALKDMRTAEIGFKQANGAYSGNLQALQEFVRSGTIPMVKAIGQVPDTLTEQEALDLKIIVRDTIMAPALDSLFLAPRMVGERLYPFDVNTFTNSPVSNKPFILKSGMVNSSGRNMSVFQVKDPHPMVKGDTLFVGNLEKVSTAGNWTGE